MRRFYVSTLALLFVSAAAADPVPLATQPGGTLVGGDSPPTTVFVYAGQGELATDVTPSGEIGTFTIAGIPATATVEQAYFITGIWDHLGAGTHSINLVFDGTNYGTIVAAVVDLSDNPANSLDLGGYLVDVTGDVSGNGSYSYTIFPNQPGNGAFGSLLAVVYSDPGLPTRQIHLNFGAESIQNASSTSTFAAVTGGSGTLHLFTQADQAGASEGVESIEFNGSVVLGGSEADIFNGNQGDFASYFALPVSTMFGTNFVTVTTGEDWFGWHFAALVSPQAPVSVEAGSWGEIKSRFR